MKHIPCVAAVRIARPAAADCAVPAATIPVPAAAAPAVMTVRAARGPAPVAATQPVPAAAAAAAAEPVGETAAPATVQQLVEWIVLEGAKEIAAVYALRIVERPVYQHLEHLNCRR